MSSTLNDANVLSLRCFIAVVETHSFTSASRQLRIATSSVTKQVQMLERALKVALVHRTTRRISVTDEGERFYVQCVDILAQIEKAAAGLVGEQELVGQLRINAPPSLATAVIAPHLNAFFSQYPRITVDLMVSSATPDLVRERIDVAIVISEEPPNKQSRIALSDNRQVICASPAYLEKYGTPSSPEELARHRCLMGRFSQVAEGWQLKRGTEWQVYKPNVVLLSDDGEVLRRACLEGTGIALLYRFHVRDDLRTGSLVEVLGQFEPKPKNIFAIIPHREIVPPPVKAFIEFMRRLLAAH